MKKVKLVKKRMVEAWLIYGLIASLFWGSYIIVSKVVTSDNYFGFNTNTASLLMLVGIAIVFGGYFISAKPTIPQNVNGILLGVLAGGLWAGGMVMTFLAIKSGADVSRLSPIYNTNTLVAVILGILLLHEIPQAASMIKVLLGGFLITVGAILVAG